MELRQGRLPIIQAAIGTRQTNLFVLFPVRNLPKANGRTIVTIKTSKCDSKKTSSFVSFRTVCRTRLQDSRFNIDDRYLGPSALHHPLSTLSRITSDSSFTATSSLSPLFLDVASAPPYDVHPLPSMSAFNNIEPQIPASARSSVRLLTKSCHLSRF